MNYRLQLTEFLFSTRPYGGVFTLDMQWISRGLLSVADQFWISCGYPDIQWISRSTEEGLNNKDESKIFTFNEQPSKPTSEKFGGRKYE